MAGHDDNGRPRYLGVTVWMSLEERTELYRMAEKFGMKPSEFLLLVSKYVVPELRNKRA